MRRKACNREEQAEGWIKIFKRRFMSFGSDTFSVTDRIFGVLLRARQKCSVFSFFAIAKRTLCRVLSVAEKEGFEPSLRFNPYYSLSRGAP